MDARSVPAPPPASSAARAGRSALIPKGVWSPAKMASTSVRLNPDARHVPPLTAGNAIPQASAPPVSISTTYNPLVLLVHPVASSPTVSIATNLVPFACNA